ncbi:hypothetical protein LWI28_024307 [Acer negundo]|uniref:AAA+ ATPase domain-containing protein n=1 Tax=Acer negundo TaxID=4023 RepID=A0AAD5NN93_ACENE|nr:hypothetical protein LWI28_024307 [Acer negundo]
MMESEGSSNEITVANHEYLNCDFSDVVFSWSLEDIFNENLFKHKVQKIPETFQSVEQYFGSFVYPLLEETRAQLCSSFDTIVEAPYAEVVVLEKSHPRYDSGSYNVKVDEWKNRFSSGKEPYKTLPGDVLILADAKPESASDLQRLGRMWTFLLVTKIPDEYEKGIGYRHFDFQVKASRGNQVDDDMKKSLFMIFLINIIPSRRIWNSLYERGNLKIINEVLCTNSVVKENCQLCVQKEGIGYENFCPNLSSTLNNSQVKAISACLSKMHCDHKSSVDLICGPPGTGKTTTVSILLFNLLKMKCRTLVCAPTNVAIKEVASHVLKLVKESYQDDSGRDTMFCPLGDILLFGNKDRLKVGDEVEEIYMDYRLKRLEEYFSDLTCSQAFSFHRKLTTHWKQCFNSMVDVLKDCVSQYHVFLENGNGKSMSFLEFVREELKCAATQLRNCLFVFYTHIPKCVILEHNLQNIQSFISLLDSFESLLLHENVASEELEELFSHPVEDFSELITDRKNLLQQRRSECYFALDDLRDSLNSCNLPSVMNQKSLMEKASLIFCTASSSYKLHSVAMESLNILVIDEAAQLRESESTIPLQLPDIKHAILIGDECQLPAMVASNVSNEAGFGRSLFERLSTLGHPKHLLSIQYRMHPSISFFPNLQFYQNQILDGPNVKSISYEKHYLPGPMFGTYSFINILGGREELDDVGHSRKNLVEVAVVLKILLKLYKAWIGSNRKLSVGVVSPYAAQVLAIKDRLGDEYESSDGFSVKVKSVDGFQGGEEDIIIISTVRSNAGGSIGFLSKPQRVNVALTRARHCLWILGSERTLTRSESVWESLVCDAKDRHRFFNADEDNDLAKAILQVKKELDELEELLNPDSILFRNQRWKIVFSDNFLQSFKKLKSAQKKKSVINLLLKLASGWRPKKKKIDSVCESSLHIVKHFKVEGLNIVCTIDIVKELQYIQVLKVWDILPLEDVSKLVKRLDDIFVKYTDDYVNRCKEKCLEGNLEVPKTWVASSEIVCVKELSNENENDLNGDAFDGRSYVENAKVSESLLLIKFYSLSSDIVSHLLSDRDGRELDLPFEVTDEQREMILFPRSTFIHGRSGTGKTTILIMKLFQKEKLHHLAMEGFYGAETKTDRYISLENEVEEVIEETKRPILRQLFVTVSPKLCFAVKQHISHLKSSALGEKFPDESSLLDVDDFDDAAEFNDIPNSFVDIPLKSFPLVITYHKFLMMLDGTLVPSYFERFLDIKKPSDGRIQSSRSVALHTFIRTKEVNFERFGSLYWSHFNTELTRKLDSSRVFTEIISHIKGGLRAMDVGDGRLSREDYVQLSGGRVSNLSTRKREKIYDVFLNYEKMKVENGEFDLADIVIDLHSRLRDENIHVDGMDFVYIDEVQDLTMSQIALFKYICRNVDEGFVFSGDTAQTIARGVDFRFQDIRALFYKKFVLESSCNGHVGREQKGQISEVLSLRQNFRTHAGVLKLAQSIIELLFRFFPHSIDVLKPEISLIYGEPPVLLESENNEDAIIKIFGNRGNFGGNIVGFGAQQVILVRDDCARKEISNRVGKQALVLTILECKGLEFQDVLLYNFFGSSTLKNKWRVIYEYMKEQDLLDSNSPRCFPSFDEAKHSILCSELKQLYVGITRTRQRLWIWENMEEFSKPMFDLWKKKSLVQVRQLDDSLAQAMQVASSSEEWRSQGIKLFHEHNYEMATMCFERAGDTYWERRSKAASLKAAADRVRNSNPEEANIILREAAEIFEAIGKADTAARCFSDLGDYERAGRIYLEKCEESELERAAECFYLAGCFERSAKVYAKGNFFSECLNACSIGKLFDLGLQCIDYWKQHTNTDISAVKRRDDINKIEQDFLESCALHYHKLKDGKSMMKFVKAFHSMDWRRSFLKSLNCLNELLLLEEESGNFLEAATIAKLRGDVIHSAGLLQKAGNFKEASTLILNYVFSNSLWSHGSKGWPLKQFSQKEELLEKAKSFAKNDSNQFYEFVCNEAEILSNNQANCLLTMNQQLNASKRHQSIRGEILSARMILDVHLYSNTSKYEWEDGWILNPMKFSEEKICKRKVSIDTLVYFWNYWKDQIVNIFKFLGYLETHQYDIDCYGDFCLNYLGVLKQCKSQYNLDSFYHLLKCDANWVRQLDHGYVKRNGNLVSIDVHHLVSSARSYWSAEFLSVGMKVLDNLEALYKLSTKNSTSVFCQIMSLTYVYEVGKFLLDSKFLHRQFSDAKKLQKFLELSTCNIFGYIFPLDWRESLRENMISLRGTEVYRSILEDIIFQCIGLKKNLSFGQIGRVAVMICGSGKMQNELYQQVVKKCDGNSPWKVFLESLYAKMVLESQQSSAPHNRDILLNEVSVVQKFHGALLDTYEANWREEHDYISPDCFLYLIERLVLMLSCFQGCVLSTKSSFVDWLVHLDGRTEPISFLQADGRQPIGHVLESVTHIVQLLLYNKGDTLQWIRKCHTNVNSYSLVVLRLFVIVCLLHLNFGNCVSLLFNLLGKKYITNQLPGDFYVALCRGREHNFRNVNVFAEAFKKIGNPLVIASVVKGCPNFTSPEAILVDMKTSQSKEDILGILFPKNEEFQGHTEVAESDSASLADQDLNTHILNEDKLEMNLIRQFWKIFEALNLVDKEKDQKSVVLNAPSIKVDVEKIIHLLTAVMDGFDSEDKRQLDKAVSMLEELKQLLAVLDGSELELENNVSTIEELLQRLQSRRPTMEPLLNHLFLKQPSNLEGKESETGMASSSKSDVENTDSSKVVECSDSGNPRDSSATNVSGNQSRKHENESKGKKKSNKKPNRNKGRKNKRP